MLLRETREAIGPQLLQLRDAITQGILFHHAIQKLFKVFPRLELCKHSVIVEHLFFLSYAFPFRNLILQHTTEIGYHTLIHI